MGNSELKTIGNNISKLLKKKGVSQVDFAKAIGVDESTVGKWILGRNFTTIAMAQKIANYFGISIEELTRDNANYEQIEDVNFLMRELPGATEDEARAMRLYWENIVKRERYD